MAIFTDIELVELAEVLRVEHDRRVSLPVLRDAVATIEAEFFRRLAMPGGKLNLGRVGTIDVAALENPDEPWPAEVPREFYLRSFETFELAHAIEDAADSEGGESLPLLGDEAAWARYRRSELLKKRRQAARKGVDF